MQETPISNSKVYPRVPPDHDAVDYEEDDNDDVDAIQGPCRCYLKSHVALAFEVSGDHIMDNFFKFRGFKDPSDQDELCHTSLSSKI